MLMYFYDAVDVWGGRGRAGGGRRVVRGCAGVGVAGVDTYSRGVMFGCM